MKNKEVAHIQTSKPQDGPQYQNHQLSIVAVILCVFILTYLKRGRYEVK